MDEVRILVDACFLQGLHEAPDVRVVKGGSWKDRAYYLQSSTRRYYDQDKSTSWIGFRCAMDRLGSRVQ